MAIIIQVTEGSILEAKTGSEKMYKCKTNYIIQGYNHTHQKNVCFQTYYGN